MFNSMMSSAMCTPCHYGTPIYVYRTRLRHRAQRRFDWICVGRWSGDSREMVGTWSGYGREMVGRWSGDGREIAGRWSGDGRDMVGRWSGDGREMVGRWSGDGRGACGRAHRICMAFFSYRKHHLRRVSLKLRTLKLWWNQQVRHTSLLQKPSSIIDCKRSYD
jgi:hypothetical protein